METIFGFGPIRTLQRLEKGWSDDEKFFIEMMDGRSMLLRRAAAASYGRKKAEFAYMTQAAALGIPMSEPLAFGLFNRGRDVGTLLSWCPGDDADAVLPTLTAVEQYRLGAVSGTILRCLHSLAAPADQESWAVRFGRKTKRRIDHYRDCGIEIPDADVFVCYLQDQRHLLTGRPQCCQHGDYHVGNMIIGPDQGLAIIDFNRFDVGDPWEEFNRLVWTAAVSPPFASGQLHAYFDGEPPAVFFELLAFYMASNALASVPWAKLFGDGEVAFMKEQSKTVFSWFDGFQQAVPSWYLPYPPQFG